MMLRRLKSVSKCFKNIFRGYQECFKVVKLRLGALIPRSVCLSVICCTVCPPKITKNYKTLQNLSKHYKTLENYKTRYFCPLPPPHTLLCVKTVKEASTVCRCFLDGVVIFLSCLMQWSNEKKLHCRMEKKKITEIMATNVVVSHPPDCNAATRANY